MPSNEQAGTALVVGAGDFFGLAIARRFAREGLHVVATRRRGDLGKLTGITSQDGGSATGVHSDARDEEQVVRLIAEVEANNGPIDVTVFNVGGNVRFPLLETSTRVYRKVWEMCALAGLLVGRETSLPTRFAA